MKKDNGGFDSLGEFLVSVRSACDREKFDERLKNLVTRTAGHLGEADDSQGGFTVPVQFIDEILIACLEEAIVRPKARIFPMVSDRATVPILYDTDRSSTIFGGVDWTWTEEAADKSSNITKPSLGSVQLDVHKPVASCYVSNELESDYGAFGDFMTQAFGSAVRFLEDEVFLWGTGVGQPLGMLHANNGARIAVNRATINDVAKDDIVLMASRMPPSGWRRAVWLANSDVLGKLFTMISSSPSEATFMDLSGHADGVMRIMGRPLIITEKAQTLGTTGDLSFLDIGSYIIGDRSWEVAGTRHDPTGFLKDESFWKVVLRVDGQPIIASAYTPRYSSTTLSPFIVLTDPA